MTSPLPTLVAYSRPADATGAGLPFTFMVNAREYRGPGPLVAEQLPADTAAAFGRMAAEYRIDLDRDEAVLRAAEGPGSTATRARTRWDLTQQIMRNMALRNAGIPDRSAGLLVPVPCAWVPEEPHNGRLYFMWQLVVGDKRRALALGFDGYLKALAAEAAALPPPTPKEVDDILSVDAEALLPASCPALGLGGLFHPPTRAQYEALISDGAADDEEGGPEPEPGSAPGPGPTPGTEKPPTDPLPLGQRDAWIAHVQAWKEEAPALEDASSSKPALLQHALRLCMDVHNPCTDSKVVIPVLDPEYDPATAFPTIHPLFAPPVRWRMGCAEVSVLLRTGRTLECAMRAANGLS